MNKCSNCKFANRAGNRDSVFCLFWYEELSKSKGMTEEEFVRSRIFKETDINNIGFGWGYPHQKFINIEEEPKHSDTATSSLMWSNQICIQKDETCNNYKSKDERVC